MSRATILLTISALLAAYPVVARELSSPEKALVEKRIKRDLKDPFSVQIEWSPDDGGTTYCGRYNAKNSYGGYVGWRIFGAGVDRNAAGEITKIKFYLDENTLPVKCPALGDE